MGYDPERHHRRSIRWRGYDYSRPGAYFVTINAYQPGMVFGRVVDGRVSLTPIGMIVQACWNELPNHFPNARLDEHVIMPDHVHLLIWLVETDEAVGKKAVIRPTDGPMGTAPGSLAAIVQNFKSVSARRINQITHQPGGKIWQRNYYERVIRDEAELNRARQYIGLNPERYQQ